ncbi:hypothetical protein RhiirA1_471315 [Rhizophagus irregularis]|uniref:Uncharacterized protein n=1 Tax=Rhizophagus irregularis TaxID=588596 RepID=A0A2N0R4H5_9GLOM|nr:hypothetical protein RhiirA1_471315 [Rhizophagus irregularis]
MNVDITSPSAPASSLIFTVPSGLPINRVPVITRPPPTNTSLDSSIHAHSLPVSTNPSSNDKGKSVAFDIPERWPSPDGNAAAIKSAPSRYYAAAYLRNAPDAFKTKFTTNCSMYDEVDCSLSQYSSYGARARCDGSGDNKKILVFFNDQHDFTDCDSRQSRDKSTSRSRSRSTSRSRNNSSSSRSNNNNNNINTSRPNVSNCKNQSNNNNTNSRNNANSSGSTQSSHTLRPNDTTSTSPNNHPNCTLPQHIIDELKAQIEKIAHTLIL